MTWYVHINRGTIDGNRKHNRNDPPIAVKHGKHGKSRYGMDVRIGGPCRVVYDNAGILECGAKVVIECENEPVITQPEVEPDVR